MFQIKSDRNWSFFFDAARSGGIFRLGGRVPQRERVTLNMCVERGTSTRRFLSVETAARLFRVGEGAWRLNSVRHAGLVAFLLVCLPTLVAGLGAGESLNRAFGQSESDAVVSNAQASSGNAGLSAQRVESSGFDARKSLRERSEPTVTGAAMHVALFVPRN